MPTTSPKSTVLLYATVDTFDLARGPAAMALSLCDALQGGLTGFLLSLDANMPSRGEGRSLARMDDEFDRRRQVNTANAEALLAECASRGVDAQAITTIDHSRGVTGCLADHARLHDVVVIGADSTGMMSDRLVAESLLFEIGRPMLVVPAGHDGVFRCARIAVGWDNSRVSARALGDALAVLPGLQDVVLLTIGGEKAIQSSLDDQAVEAALNRRGIPVRVVREELNDRSIDAALQDVAADSGADLLVMGGYGHSRLRDFVLGGATLSVLREPRMPVLLSH
jgi:nucleotide-binding universal stress UspA family protein